MTCFSASIVSMGASCNALPPAGAANPRPTRRAGVVKVKSEHCLPPHWSALRERHLPSSPCWDTVGARLGRTALLLGRVSEQPSEASLAIDEEVARQREMLGILIVRLRRTLGPEHVDS